MADPTSIADIDLMPIAGRTYFNTDREWREEFIYFLMVDRFQDDVVRPVAGGAARSPGIAAPNGFYGGTISGVTRNLDYIAGLGCTAIWLSPVFENNPGAYHGYDINNYLAIDPHFGSKRDLIDLVAAAHGYKKNGQPFPIRVILDVVINHSGDNWFTREDFAIFIPVTRASTSGGSGVAIARCRSSFATAIGITGAEKWRITMPIPRTSTAIYPG
jgi:alpha-amylase